MRLEVVAGILDLEADAHNCLAVSSSELAAVVA